MSSDEFEKKSPARKSQPLALGEVLASLMTNDQVPLAKSFLLWRVRERWPEIVGADVAKLSTPIGYRRQILFLNVRHSAVIHQLSFMNRELTEKINRHVGRRWVRGVRYTTLAHIDGVSEETLKKISSRLPL